MESKERRGGRGGVIDSQKGNIPVLFFHRVPLLSLFKLKRKQIL